MVLGDAVLVRPRVDVWFAVTVVLAVFVTGALLGLSPLMVAVLRKEPASTLAWVTV